MTYSDQIRQADDLISTKASPWSGISAEAVARMRLQNRFRTGLDIARYREILFGQGTKAAR